MGETLPWTLFEAYNKNVWTAKLRGRNPHLCIFKISTPMAGNSELSTSRHGKVDVTRVRPTSRNNNKNCEDDRAVHHPPTSRFRCKMSATPPSSFLRAAWSLRLSARAFFAASAWAPRKRTVGWRCPCGAGAGAPPEPAPDTLAAVVGALAGGASPGAPPGASDLAGLLGDGEDNDRHDGDVGKEGAEPRPRRAPGTPRSPCPLWPPTRPPPPPSRPRPASRASGPPPKSASAPRLASALAAAAWARSPAMLLTACPSPPLPQLKNRHQAYRCPVPPLSLCRERKCGPQEEETARVYAGCGCGATCFPRRRVPKLRNWFYCVGRFCCFALFGIRCHVVTV